MYYPFHLDFSLARSHSCNEAVGVHIVGFLFPCPTFIASINGFSVFSCRSFLHRTSELEQWHFFQSCDFLGYIIHYVHNDIMKLSTCVTDTLEHEYQSEAAMRFLEFRELKWHDITCTEKFQVEKLYLTRTLVEKSTSCFLERDISVTYFSNILPHYYNNIDLVYSRWASMWFIK